MKNYKGSSFSNYKNIGKSEIVWTLVSGKPRGRFSISQKGLFLISASLGINILKEGCELYALI